MVKTKGENTEYEEKKNNKIRINKGSKKSR